MLRKAKKLRKELRSLLEDARTRVAELETQVLDSKFEIDSLKASLVVSDENDCVDCSVLTMKILQPSHVFNFGVGMTFVSYPLVLTPVV
jgi:hypothetical protein